MKRYILLLAIAISTTACQKMAKGRSETTFSVTRKNDLTVSSARIANDTLNLLVTTAGKILFNPTQTAIESLQPGGYFEYRKNEREVEAEEADGRVEVTVSINGREVQTAEQRATLIREAYQALKYTDSLRNSGK